VKLGDKLFLEWYDKKPANTNVQPKGEKVILLTLQHPLKYSAFLDLKKDCKTVPISLHTHYVVIKKIFCPTSAHDRKVHPRAPMVIIPSLLFANGPLTYVHELSFEII
jgi:hypothetical protein